MKEIASFAAGCFWGVEEKFRKVKGVLSTQVGYQGGTTAFPSYEDVCTGETGHAETVELEYDPKMISYEELLNVFWNIHDPTTPNRQGADIGSQYRSVIFYYTEQQKEIAEQSKEIFSRSYDKPITTEIMSAPSFYPAEEYHQRYLEKKRTSGG